MSFFESRKRLVAATFLSVLDYGDMLYMHASAQSLQALDTVYHGALRFITNFKSLTHRCVLYSRVGWSSLSTRRLMHWHILIYKAILGLLPSYLLTFISQRTSGSYNLRSQNFLLLSVPRWFSWISLIFPDLAFSITYSIFITLIFGSFNLFF